MPTIEEVTTRLARAGHKVTFVSGPYRGEGSKSARYKGYVTITATIDPALPPVAPCIAYVPSPSIGEVTEHAAKRLEAENAIATKIGAAMDAIAADNLRLANAIRTSANELLRVERGRREEARRYGSAESDGSADLITRAREWLDERAATRRETKWPTPSIEECLVMDLVDAIKSSAVTR